MKTTLNAVSILPLSVSLVLAALGIDAAHAQCLPNHPTQLASTCALGWRYDPQSSNSDNFNPWPSFCEDQDRLNPATVDTSQRSVLSRESCPGQLVVHDVIGGNRMAVVSCGNSKTNRVLVNLDSLQCSDDNTHVQARDRSGPFETGTCPVTDRTFEERLQQFAQSVPDHVLNGFEQQRYAAFKEEIRRTQATVDHDMTRVLEMYSEDTSNPAAAENAKTAVTDSLRELQRYQAQAHARYGANCDQPANPVDADQVRGQRTCSRINAAVAKAEFFLAGGTANEVFSRISHYFQSHGAGADFLAARTVLFYGHSLAQRRQMRARDEVHFVREIPSSEMASPPASGGLPALPPYVDPHDGYIFGGDRLGAASGHGMDCSSFSISRDLIQGGSPDSPPTSALRDIARLLRHEPGVTAQSLGRWANYRNCFNIVDVRHGEAPRTLDLAISVAQRPSHGHVAVVESYDRARGEIVGMEAKGGDTGTLTRCIRPVFETACAVSPAGNPGPRPDPPGVRPDVYVLRFKAPGAPGTESCPLRLR